LLTPILIILCVFLMGGGHGYFEPVFIVFPFATILFIWFKTMNLFFLAASLIQYPLYGLLIDVWSQRFQFIAVLIFIVHTLVGIISYLIRPEAFQ